MSGWGEREIGSDGLTDNERAIMDLADAGEPVAAIARRLGLKPAHVDRVVGIFSFSETRQAAKDQRVRRASQQLAAACIATGSCFR